MEIRMSRQRMWLYMNRSGQAFENKFPQETTAAGIYLSAELGINLVPFLFSRGVALHEDLFI